MNVFKKFINKVKGGIRAGLSRFREIGGYIASFTPFGKNMLNSSIIKACIRPIADQTSKAIPSCKDQRLQTILTYNPNEFMSGRDFLYKVRYLYELNNTVFIVIMRDQTGKVEGYYPVPHTSYEALETTQGDLWIVLGTSSGEYIFPWQDLVVLRKDYIYSDIVGDGNKAIFEILELINTTNQGIANAVKSTANLRGIIKTTNTMLDPEDLKKQRDEFVENYMTMSNSGGVAALDASMEFKQITNSPTVTNWATMKEFRENIYRYFGVNDGIVMGTATTDQMQTFYELTVEPFLIALSQEMTRKTYSAREIAFGNEIRFNSSQIQFMSMSDKLALKDYIDRGAMTPNTWCDIVGLPHVEGGDEPIRRLDTAPVSQVAQSLSGNKKKDEEEEEEDE